MNTRPLLIDASDSRTFALWWKDYMTRISAEDQPEPSQEQLEVVFRWLDANRKDWNWWDLLGCAALVLCLALYRDIDFGKATRVYLDPARLVSPPESGHVTLIEEMWDFLHNRVNFQFETLEERYRQLESISRWCATREGRLAKARVDAINRRK